MRKSQSKSLASQGEAPDGKKKRGLPPHLVPGNPGNKGGKKGRSGRKPDAWKKLAARMVNRESTIRAAKRILRNDKHPAYLGALKFWTEQAYGKVAQGVEVSGKLTLEQILSASRAQPEGE